MQMLLCGRAHAPIKSWPVLGSPGRRGATQTKDSPRASDGKRATAPSLQRRLPFSGQKKKRRANPLTIISDGKPSLAPAFRLTMWQELRISPGRQRPPWDTRRGETRISVKTRHETWLRPPERNPISPLFHEIRLHPSTTRPGFARPNATHPLHAAGSRRALSPRRPYPVTSSNPPMHRMSTYVNFKNLSWLIRFCSLLPKTVATTANGMQSATTCSTSPV